MTHNTSSFIEELSKAPKGVRAIHVPLFPIDWGTTLFAAGDHIEYRESALLSSGLASTHGRSEEIDELILGSFDVTAVPFLTSLKSRPPLARAVRSYLSGRAYAPLSAVSQAAMRCALFDGETGGQLVGELAPAVTVSRLLGAMGYAHQLYLYSTTDVSAQRMKVPTTQGSVAAYIARAADIYADVRSAPTSYDVIRILHKASSASVERSRYHSALGISSVKPVLRLVQHAAVQNGAAVH